MADCPPIGYSLDVHDKAVVWRQGARYRCLHEGAALSAVPA